MAMRALSQHIYVRWQQRERENSWIYLLTRKDGRDRAFGGTQSRLGCKATRMRRTPFETIEVRVVTMICFVLPNQRMITTLFPLKPAVCET